MKNTTIEEVIMKYKEIIRIKHKNETSKTEYIVINETLYEFMKDMFEDKINNT